MWVLIAINEYGLRVEMVRGGVDGHAGGSAFRPVGVTAGGASRRGNCESVSSPAPSPTNAPRISRF